MKPGQKSSSVAKANLGDDFFPLLRYVIMPEEGVVVEDGDLFSGLSGELTGVGETPIKEVSSSFSGNFRKLEVDVRIKGSGQEDSSKREELEEVFGD